MKTITCKLSFIYTSKSELKRCQTIYNEKEKKKEESPAFHDF